MFEQRCGGARGVGTAAVEASARQEGWTDRTQKLGEVRGEFVAPQRKRIGTGQALKKMALEQVGAWGDVARRPGSVSGSVSKERRMQARGQRSSGAS